MRSYRSILERKGTVDAKKGTSFFIPMVRYFLFMVGLVLLDRFFFFCLQFLPSGNWVWYFLLTAPPRPRNWVWSSLHTVPHRK